MAARSHGPSFRGATIEFINLTFMSLSALTQRVPATQDPASLALWPPNLPCTESDRLPHHLFSAPRVRRIGFLILVDKSPRITDS